MGIDGLHPVLKPYLTQKHVGSLAGHRVGVDAWSWLHRGAVGAAADLALGRRPWEQRGYDPPWVTFCLKMASVLQAASVTPVLVFDGCRLPAKAGTNKQRRQRRAEAKERAAKLMAEGREQEAQNVFQQCIDVTADMAHDVIMKLRERRVEFVVAPYEADAQLAYLSSIPESEGGIAAVVTEDSDLVAYGCRRILFKLDGAGHGLELSLDLLFSSPEAAANGGKGGGSSGGSSSGSSGSSGGGGSVVSFRGWTLDMLQAACVLAGCDFLPSLKGISFRTAAGFVARRRSLGGALKAIRLEKRFQLTATSEYCAAAERALLAFKHALVFCPNTAGGSCRRLTPLPPPGGEGSCADLAHLGAELEPDVARSIAYGNLHPHTLQPYAVQEPQRLEDQQGPPQQQHHHQRQQQQHHHHHQQQHHHRQQPRPQPSIASRKQLGTWVAGAAHSQHQQHGLGPSQPAVPLPQRPLWAAQQQQWQQHMQGSTDISDVLQLCQPAGMQHAARQASAGTAAAGPPAAVTEAQQRPSNPFARQLPPWPAAAGPAPASDGSEDACQRGGSFRGPVEPAVQAQAAVGGSIERPQQLEEPSSSWEGTLTAAPASLASSAADASQPLRPITNHSVPHLSQQGTATCASSGAAGPPTAALLQQRVWDTAEQYNYQQHQQQYRSQHQQARSVPPATASGSKRKSGGGAGGSGGKKAAKALAPPTHRISRFFVPLTKKQ